MWLQIEVATLREKIALWTLMTGSRAIVICGCAAALRSDPVAARNFAVSFAFIMSLLRRASVSSGEGVPRRNFEINTCYVISLLS